MVGLVDSICLIGKAVTSTTQALACSNNLNRNTTMKVLDSTTAPQFIDVPTSGSSDAIHYYHLNNQQLVTTPSVNCNTPLNTVPFRALTSIVLQGVIDSIGKRLVNTPPYVLPLSQSSISDIDEIIKLRVRLSEYLPRVAKTSTLNRLAVDLIMEQLEIGYAIRTTIIGAFSNMLSSEELNAGSIIVSSLNACKEYYCERTLFINILSVVFEPMPTHLYEGARKNFFINRSSESLEQLKNEVNITSDGELWNAVVTTAFSIGYILKQSYDSTTLEASLPLAPTLAIK